MTTSDEHTGHPIYSEWFPRQGTTALEIHDIEFDSVKDWFNCSVRGSDGVSWPAVLRVVPPPATHGTDES